jgi:hypothetical protein
MLKAHVIGIPADDPLLGNVSKALRDDKGHGNVKHGTDHPYVFRLGGEDLLAHGEALFAAATEPRQMVVLDRYGHNDIWNEELAEAIAGFVDDPF